MFILGMLTGAGIMFVGCILGAAISVGSQPRKTDDFDVDIPS
jgi:hypothetical protein